MIHFLWAFPEQTEKSRKGYCTYTVLRCNVKVRVKIRERKKDDDDDDEKEKDDDDGDDENDDDQYDKDDVSRNKYKRTE